MRTQIKPTEKLKRMLKWLDYQNQFFNDQFQNIAQLEMLYDYSVNNDIEFLDAEYLMSDNITEEEYKNAKEFINKVYKMNR